MIKLIKLASNEFIIQNVHAGVRIECDLAEAASILIIFGVSSDELELALGELSKLGHDVADFGIQGLFTHTKKMDLAA